MRVGESDPQLTQENSEAAFVSICKGPPESPCKGHGCRATSSPTFRGHHSPRTVTYTATETAAAAQGGRNLSRLHLRAGNLGSNPHLGTSSCATLSSLLNLSVPFPHLKNRANSRTYPRGLL